MADVQSLFGNLADSHDESIEEVVLAFRENLIRCLVFDVLPPPPLDVLPLLEMADREICSAKLVVAWTMFESLSADLWVAAVNAFPNPLAHLAVKTANRIKTRIEEPDKEPPAPRKFGLDEISELSGGNFDLSKSMGSILRSTERVK